MMDYPAMTVEALKSEIRTRTDVQPFTSRTRKSDLIEWLTADDEVSARIEEENAKAVAMAATPVFIRPSDERTESRIWGYWRCNGGQYLTKRQRKQVGRMAKRAAYREGVSA